MKAYIQFLSPLFFKYYIILLIVLLCIIIHYRVFKKPINKIERFQNPQNPQNSKNPQNNNTNNTSNNNSNNKTIKTLYAKEKQISENRKKEIDSQNKEILELEKENKALEGNYNEEKELNNILVNSVNDEELIRNLIKLLRKRQINGASIDELNNLNRLIEERLEKADDYTPDNEIFFQASDLGNDVLNELQNEYNELLQKEKDKSDKIIDDMNKQMLDKENKKLLKYNKAMSDHYQYLKSEKNKLNLVNLSGMMEDDFYSIIDDIDKYSSSNNNTNDNNIEGYSNYSVTIKERMDEIKNNANKNNANKNNAKLGVNDGDADVENNNGDDNDNNDNIIHSSSVSNKKDEDLVVGFINYVFEVLNSYINLDTSNNKNKKNNKNNSSINMSYISSLVIEIKNILNIMFKEDNLLASGLIFIILSMSLYFIDITS